MILSILAIVGIISLMLFQINVQRNPLIAGLGFTLSIICIIVAIIIGLFYYDR